MKQRIIIGLGLFSLIFFLGGFYLITAIEKATSTLDNLIKLHQVEILRDNLLIQINRVQSDLSLKNSPYARDIDTMVSHVKKMVDVANNCFTCHHSEEMTKDLTELRTQIKKFEDGLRTVLTSMANGERLEAEEGSVFKIGENLKTKIHTMISLTKMRLDKRTQKELDEIAHTKAMLFIFIGLGPILTIILAYIFIRGFTKPIRVLLDATRRLKSGNLEYRVRTGGLKNEFRELAESFNETVSSLKDQMEKMQRAEQMTVVSQMVTGLAYEIRNPLAGIKASMQVLSEELDLSNEDRDILFRVVDEIQGIESSIKSLLTLAKPPKPQLMSVDVNEIIDNAINFSRQYPIFSSSNKKTINILKDLGDHLPETIMDPVQLRQVILNLLLNAAEAMPEGGILTFKTSHDESKNSIQMEISDTGKGIDDKIADKIFQPFFTTKPRGTGLELAISKQFLEQHGGTINFFNNPGGGTVFKIILPLKQGEEAK